MIENIKDIQEILKSRFGNVIIGSVILSSIMMNARGILIFIFSDKNARLSILRDWKFDFIMDLIIPIFISSIYIVVIPWISAFIKKKITNEIYKREQDAERDRILIDLTGMQDVAVATAKSTSEYAEKFASNEIQTWLNEKEQTRSELADVRAENILLKSKNEDLTRIESSLSNSSSVNAMLYERCLTSMTHMTNVIQSINNASLTTRVIKNGYEYNADSVEYKDYIIQQLLRAAKYMFELNNNKPINTTGEWMPPLNAAPATELLTKIETEMAQKEEAKKIKSGVMVHSKIITNQPS